MLNLPSKDTKLTIDIIGERQEPAGDGLTIKGPVFSRAGGAAVGSELAHIHFNIDVMNLYSNHVRFGQMLKKELEATGKAHSQFKTQVSRSRNQLASRMKYMEAKIRKTGFSLGIALQDSLTSVISPPHQTKPGSPSVSPDSVTEEWENQDLDMDMMGRLLSGKASQKEEAKETSVRPEKLQLDRTALVMIQGKNNDKVSNVECSVFNINLECSVFNIIFEFTDQNQTTPVTDAQVHHRPKRQLIIAAMGIATMIASGLSVYTASQVQEVKKEAEINKELVMATLNGQARVIKANVANIQLFQGVFKEIDRQLQLYDEQEVLQYFLDTVTEQVAFYEEHVNDFVNSMVMLSKGSLSPFLLDLEDLDKAITEVRDKVERKNLRLIETNPFRYDLTFQTTHGVIDILLHIPVVDEVLELFQFIPLPTLVDQDLFLTFQPRDRFLAVDKHDDRAGVTIENLSGCKHYPTENLYVCPNQLMYSDVMVSTCLGAIFAGDPERMLKLCPVQYSRTAEFVYKINNQQVVIIAPESEAALVNCRDDIVHQQLEIHVAKVIDIPKGCELRLVEGIYKNFEDFTVQLNTSELVHIPISDITEVIPITHRDLIQETLRKVKTVSKDELEALTRIQDKEDRSHLGMYVLIGIALGTIVLMACLYLKAYVFYRIQKKKKKKKKKPRRKARVNRLQRNKRDKKKKVRFPRTIVQVAEDAEDVEPVEDPEYIEVLESFEKEVEGDSYWAGCFDLNCIGCSNKTIFLVINSALISKF